MKYQGSSNVAINSFNYLKIIYYDILLYLHLKYTDVHTHAHGKIYYLEARIIVIKTFFKFINFIVFLQYFVSSKIFEKIFIVIIFFFIFFFSQVSLTNFWVIEALITEAKSYKEKY